jgi:hypothetical protein
MSNAIVFEEGDPSYRFCASTGLLTTVAAGTASAGHQILMGAGGTARVDVNMEWEEINP